jgi:hypothetical protein
MQLKENFKRFTCHGQYNGSLTIDVEPAKSFELIWDKGHVNGDEERIYQCLLQGAHKAFSLAKSGDCFRIKVVEIKDSDGTSPPYTFQACIEQALAKALKEYA